VLYHTVYSEFDMVCLGSGRLQSVFEVMVLGSAGAEICVLIWRGRV